ncbi:hypothetical protein AEA09_15430 [Lysinibacillus contaminans]|uniref:DUF2268 domain-containing protein n=2 Tax=Lysinibacillus contaminans TaxID=1293441 RepID=A0ABR5JXD9_9BACI|nr:hypothetical protein AEA09_15430 [Lysinibacillus contaminans]
MSVMPTQKWLLKWLEDCKKTSGKSFEEIQCEVICSPLIDLFLNASPEEIQYELRQNGLFEPHETLDVVELEAKGVWQLVQAEYVLLKERWNGPDIPIFIFPITRVNAVARKNGVAYKDAVFLFVSEELEKEELRALIAHEYNHVCRLHYINKSLDDVTLKDSLLLEGLAECAVEELYGDKWLAPWLKLYTKDELLLIWQEHFLPSLGVQGLYNHFEFLYGGQLPKWIGYCIGYEIVRSYKKNYPSNEIHEKTTDEILMGSDFPLQ